MEIPINAPVECTDGVCGRSLYVLINPVLDKVTHLVVKEDSSSEEFIVPVDLMAETVVDTIRLRCSKADLEKMDPFIKMEFIQEQVPDYSEYHGIGPMGSFYFSPYIISAEKKVYEAVEDQQIPPGELAVHRGTRVEATDGYIGHVDEFVVNPENGHITHLVMREGHLWGQKDVLIPISALGDIEKDTVSLKLDKKQIESLPSFPVSRRWS